MLAENRILPVVLFALFLSFVLLLKLDPDPDLLFGSIPGDLGDARLNNYFLENIYQFFAGGSDSLWHLGFFWPFPYLLGFSDNLFGAAPVYMVARAITGQTDTAFQIWFVMGYVVNYWAAYYALNKLGNNRLSASMGAAVFAFAIPVMAHAQHAQLIYRFGAPLALLFWVQFLERRQPWLLTIAACWLVWQFYCGIYIGFFTALLLLTVLLAHLAQHRKNLKTEVKAFIAELIIHWKTFTRRSQVGFALSWLVLLALLVILFYPYLEVSLTYQMKRSWSEISPLLPRPQSYLMADYSLIWSALGSSLGSTLPFRHEHQMFPGLVSVLLLIAGIALCRRGTERLDRLAGIMLLSLAILVVSTLYIGGYSIWYLVHWMPLVSAIRAMTRIDLIMLLPLAFVVAYVVHRLISSTHRGIALLTLPVLGALIVEFAATSLYVTNKEQWRERLASTLNRIPADIDKDKVLFLSYDDLSGWNHIPELDAMWAAITLGYKTFNGYSGSQPAAGESGYGTQYTVDCSVVPQRVMAYLDFAKNRLGTTPDYRETIGAIRPIGFIGCDPEWWETKPTSSVSQSPYSPEFFSKLAINNPRIITENGMRALTFDIENNGVKDISAQSGTGNPIAASWRYLDESCRPTSGWHTRRNLPFDIRAGGSIRLTIAIGPDAPAQSCGIEVSLVQELLFWGHDVGVKPLLVRF